MSNTDIAYCKGKGCALKESCMRYTVGNSIDPNTEGFWWMENCNPEDREGYRPTYKPPEGRGI